MSHCAYQIFQFVNSLNINDSLSEYVWSTMKFIFVYEPQIILDRHMDQLILCCLYAICKVSQIQIKFQDIISK